MCPVVNLQVEKDQNYIIVYEIEGHRVHILAVMHGKQEWPNSFGGDICTSNEMVSLLYHERHRV